MNLEQLLKQAETSFKDEMDFEKHPENKDYDPFDILVDVVLDTLKPIKDNSSLMADLVTQALNEYTQALQAEIGYHRTTNPRMTIEELHNELLYAYLIAHIEFESLASVAAAGFDVDDSGAYKCYAVKENGEFTYSDELPYPLYASIQNAKAGAGQESREKNVNFEIVEVSVKPIKVVATGRSTDTVLNNNKNKIEWKK